MAIELKLATDDTPEPWQAADVVPLEALPATELDYAREGLPSAQPKRWWRTLLAIGRRVSSPVLAVWGGLLQTAATLLLVAGNSARYLLTGGGDVARYLLSGAGECMRYVLTWAGNRLGRLLTRSGGVADWLLTTAGNVARFVLNGMGIITRWVLTAAGMSARFVLAGAANLLLLIRRGSLVGLYHRLRWGRIIDAELA
jgi:hypothetical protein